MSTSIPPPEKENSSKPYPPLDQELLNSIFSDDEDINPLSSTTLSTQESEIAFDGLSLSPPVTAGDSSDHSEPQLTTDSNFLTNVPFFDHYLQLFRASTPSATLLGQTGSYPTLFQQGVHQSSSRNHPHLPYVTGSSSSSSSNNGRNFFPLRPQYPHPGNGALYPGETLRTRSPGDIAIDYLPVGLRIGHGRGTASMAGDEHVYEEMMRVIELGDLREIQNLIEENKDHLHELMNHRFGNLVIQSLFRLCHENFINELLLFVIRREDMFVAVCVHNLGHRAIVELLDRLTTRCQQLPAASIIGRHGIILAKSFNGHEVLQRCFEKLPRQDNELILLEIARGCLELARNQAGVCILQNCIQYAQREVREALVTPLIRDADHLSRHVYGNYVVQFMIELDGANMGVRIIRELMNNFAELSVDKFGSNVVEACLSCGEAAANIIVSQIPSRQWLQIFTNEYGNYVAQKALSMAKGEAQRLLIGEIRRHWVVLQCHPNGRSVIGAIKRVKKFKSLGF